jgi:hypothetical protein
MPAPPPIFLTGAESLVSGSGSRVAKREHLRCVRGGGIKDLMARMGHDSERAALIYQHEARGADKMITATIDAHVQAEQQGRDGDDGQAGGLVPRRVMAR